MWVCIALLNMKGNDKVGTWMEIFAVNYFASFSSKDSSWNGFTFRNDTFSGNSQTFICKKEETLPRSTKLREGMKVVFDWMNRAEVLYLAHLSPRDEHFGLEPYNTPLSEKCRNEVVKMIGIIQYNNNNIPNDGLFQSSKEMEKIELTGVLFSLKFSFPYNFQRMSYKGSNLEWIQWKRKEGTWKTL